jgi:Regulator of ribonuclease activity B
VNWIYGFLLAAAFLAAWRVYGKFKAAAAQRGDDWDEQLVKNWRAQGGNGFEPVAIDFFFGVPDSEHCQQLGEALKSEGCAVDFRPATTEGASGFTLHAVKPIRVSVTEMQAHSARFRQLAALHASTYDSWATEGITRNVVPNQRLRQRGVPPSGYQSDLKKIK